MKLVDNVNDRMATKSYRQVRRMAVAIIGGTVLLLGVILIVLPGPAFLVIPAGLAILATEFAWAKHWLDRARNLIRRNGRSSTLKSSSPDESMRQG